MALEKYVSERRLGYFKSKLDSEGYKNTIETIKVNTQTQTIANKAVDLTIDTVDVSQADEKVTWTDVGEYSYEASLEKSTNGATFGIAGGSVELTSKTYVDETAPLLETEETTAGDGYNLAAIKHNTTSDKSGIVIKKPSADTAEIDWFGTSGTSENSVTLPTKGYVDGTFRTQQQVQDAIDDALADLTGIDFAVVADVASLPATGTKGVFYLVPNTGAGQNVYDEYVWLNSGTEQAPNYHYEKIGTTAVDLTGYVQETDLVEITEAEIDAMFA